MIDRLRPLAPQARWVQEEQLHLTALFLGDLADQDLADVCSQAEWVARANQPFTLRLQGVGAFPHLDRPRAMWLGVAEGGDEVTRLHTDLLDAVGEYVATRDRRPFVPHLTLARFARTGRHSPNLTAVLAGLAGYDAGAGHIDELVVYASELQRDGPEYYPLARCPLGD